MFALTEEQQALKAATRDFCAKTLAPTAKEDDEKERFRKELVTALGSQGLCGIITPEVYGGLGRGTFDYALLLEEVGRVSASYAVSIAVTGLPQVALLQMGTEAQREQWLPSLATGERIGAFALSEPWSGSDAAALRTTAARRGDAYILNGTKAWCTHGGYADVYLVMARTGGAGPSGVSAFLVPGDVPGLSVGRREEKMGLRASPTAQIVLENVEVQAEDRVGPEGAGFKIAMAALDSGRITIGAVAVGLCAAALDAAAEYATVREQFDTPIIDFQGVGFMLADMACRMEAARLMVHRAAWLKDSGLPFSAEAAMAKVVATDAAMAVTTDAVQVFGGNGYTREYPVERYMRDAKVMQIVEGTNQVQRLVIARHLKRAFSR